MNELLFQIWLLIDSLDYRGVYYEETYFDVWLVKSGPGGNSGNLEARRSLLRGSRRPAPLPHPAILPFKPGKVPSEEEKP